MALLNRKADQCRCLLTVNAAKLHVSTLMYHKFLFAAAGSFVTLKSLNLKRSTNGQPKSVHYYEELSEWNKHVSLYDHEFNELDTKLSRMIQENSAPHFVEAQNITCSN